MRKFLIIAAAAVLSVFLLFLLCGVFVPAIDRLLLWPGFRATKGLGISEEGANFAMGIAVSYVLWALVFAAVIAVIKYTLWRRKELLVVCAIIVTAVLFFQARGNHNKEFDGTWEVGDERSDFYSGGGCWRLPYWLEPTSELSKKLEEAVGNPRAVRLKFIGDTTSVGAYGHLGQYLREIRVVRIIEVQAAQPCRP